LNNILYHLLLISTT